MAKGVFMIKNKHMWQITEVTVLTGYKKAESVNDEWEHVIEQGM